MGNLGAKPVAPIPRSVGYSMGSREQTPQEHASLSPGVSQHPHPPPLRPWPRWFKTPAGERAAERNGPEAGEWLRKLLPARAGEGVQEAWAQTWPAKG